MHMNANLRGIPGKSGSMVPSSSSSLVFVATASFNFRLPCGFLDLALNLWNRFQTSGKRFINSLQSLDLWLGKLTSLTLEFSIQFFSLLQKCSLTNDIWVARGGLHLPPTLSPAPAPNGRPHHHRTWIHHCGTSDLPLQVQGHTHLQGCSEGGGRTYLPQEDGAAHSMGAQENIRMMSASWICLIGTHSTSRTRITSVSLFWNMCLYSYLDIKT